MWKKRISKRELVRRLNKRDLQVLINALIFTGCSDVTLQTEEGFQDDYVDLALKIKEMTGIDPDDKISIR